MADIQAIERKRKRFERARKDFVAAHAEKLREDYARRARHYRERAGLTHAQVARQIATDGRSALVAHYEAGRTLPSVDRLVLHCKALGVTPNDLLGFAPDPTATPPTPPSPF